MTDLIVEKAPRRIWLLLGEGEGGDHVWCDTPEPDTAPDREAVEYVRADVVKANEGRLHAEIVKLRTALNRISRESFNEAVRQGKAIHQRQKDQFFGQLANEADADAW